MTDKVKKGKLSKVETFYIAQNAATKSASEIAADLGRSVAVVTKEIGAIKAADPINSPDTEESTQIPSPVELPEAPADKNTMEGIAQAFKGVNMQQAIKRARVKHKGQKIGTVMTEEMSGKADTVRTANQGTRFANGAIHKPMGEDED
jgi:hypothetical protein